MKHPYYTMNQLMHEHYGKKIRKICIDGGFTCPNRDGTCGRGGCTFCGERGAGEQLDASKTIRQQAETVLKNAAPDSAWILYFQNFTNTYAPVSVLRQRYDEALIDDRIKVLDIGTRPDCINAEVADLLAEYAQRYEVWTELGLQTANDRTAAAINRGYDLACFERAVRLLKARGLPVIVHIILGLPGETIEDIRHTVEVLNRCGIDGIKIHSLFIMKDTQLAEQYLRGEFTPISMQTYIDWAIEVLTHISPKTVVHRITGNCLRDRLLAPDWIMQRDLMIVSIDRIMMQNGWTQGCFYKEPVVPYGTGNPVESDRKDTCTMNFRDKKSVIFDLDGTLLDTLNDLKDSINAALVHNGFPARTTDEVRQFVGNGLGKLAERAIPEGIANPLFEQVLAETRKIYAQKSNDTTKPYDGVPALLQNLLDRGYQLAVVSNKPDAQVKSLCKIYFPKIPVAVGQRDGFQLKPAPDSVLETMRQLGCTADEVVYVGDSEVDVLTAKNTGIPCISVLWGFRSKQQLLDAGAVCFAETPAEMLNLF